MKLHQIIRTLKSLDIDSFYCPLSFKGQLETEKGISTYKSCPPLKIGFETLERRKKIKKTNSKCFKKDRNNYKASRLF